MLFQSQMAKVVSVALHQCCSMCLKSEMFYNPLEQKLEISQGRCPLGCPAQADGRAGTPFLAAFVLSLFRLLDLFGGSTAGDDQKK